MKTIGRHSLHKPGDKHYPFSRSTNFKESAQSGRRRSKAENGVKPESLRERKDKVPQKPESHGLFTPAPPLKGFDASDAVIADEKRGIKPNLDIQTENVKDYEVEKSEKRDLIQSNGADSSSLKPDDETKQKIVVDRSQLQKLSTKPSFLAYLKEVWSRRDFIMTDARYKAFRTTRDYRLWRFWLIAQPLLDAAMYGLLFGVILKTSRGIDNFIGYVILGVTFFTVLTRLIGSAPGLVKNSKPLMQAFSFPRASIVFSQAIRLFLDCLPPCIVAVVFALVLQWHQLFSWTVILVVPIYFLMIGFGSGVLFVLARITAFVPDFKVIVDVLVRAWFFGSGIFFSIDRFVDHPTLHSMMTANPGYIFISSVRSVVLRGEVPETSSALAMLAWGIIPLIIGVFFFWKAENRYSTI